MDITTLSKSELIELFYAVTEKAKKKGGGDGGPKATGNEPRPSKTFTREAMNRPEGPGKKYDAPQGPDKKNRSMKKSWQWESPMGKMRGKELFESTEKAKRKSVLPPKDEAGGDDYGVPDGKARYYVGKAGAARGESASRSDFPQKTVDPKKKIKPVFSSRVDINKQNKQNPKVNKAQPSRRKELFEATEKAKKKSVLPPKDDGANRSLSASNAVQRANEAASFGQNQDYKPDFSKGQRPDERRAREMNKKPPQLPSAGRTTPRVMPGSRVDINKQNKNAAANQKKATLNKRSDFHAMKVNEAKMKRRKELQTEQAIDQYLSYESEMDDNRQLMFEVITEKGIRPPPRMAPPLRLTASQEAKKRQSESNDVKKGERWKPKDERAVMTYSKYGGWSETNNPKGDKLAENRMKKEETDSNKRIRQEGGFRARSVGYDHLRNPIIKDKYQAGSRQERPYSPENVGDQRRGAQAQKIQAATRMQVAVGKAGQQRKMGLPAIVPRRRNKEQQFDGSLVVGAESFFLQMIAATKPK